MFALDKPDARIAARKNTRLIQLPRRKQTVRILAEFLWGSHQILFYMKAAPASRYYSNLRRKWHDGRITVGTVESQADIVNEPTITFDSVRLWEQTVLRCDYLFSNSSSVRHSLRREYGLSSEVIPTGVDTRFFSPIEGRPANKRVQVLFVGSLRPFKEPDLLLSAAARFPDVDFRIAGAGPMAGELAARVEREQLRNVTLLGSLDADSIRTEYRHADIFLFPSRWEGSPKVILEASACGLPVIVRSNYSPDTVVHGLTGFQVGSDDELYSFLQALITNQDLRKTLGQAGRLHSRKFDWDLITREWEKTFVGLSEDRALRNAS
jgi:glycosyltransferase involved in cell wall biosynthesis